MFDAFIIDRIRREQERERDRQERSRPALRIEVPRSPPEAREDEYEKEERGEIVIDYRV